MNTFDYLFRFIIVGDTNVGKTCLLSQFTERVFKTEHEATIGVEFGSRILKVKEKRVKIQIWDTAGQETFKSVTRSYYKGAIAGFVVYDVTDQYSFQNAARWLEEIQAHSNEEMIIALVGNKADQEEKRKISREQGEAFAKENNLLFFETSARKGTQVDDAFYQVSSDILTKLENGDLRLKDETRIRGNTMNMRGGNAPSNSAVNLNDKNKKQASGGGCC